MERAENVGCDIVLINISGGGGGGVVKGALQPNGYSF